MIPETPRHKKRKMREQPDSRRSLYVLGVAALCGLALIAQFRWVSKNQFRFAPFSVERIRCDACRGLGMISEEDATGIRRLFLCEACFGLGGHPIRRVDEFDQLCPACIGFGRVEDGDAWRWCKRCAGRGLIRPPGAPRPAYQPPIPIFGDTNVEASVESAADSVPAEPAADAPTE